MSTILVVAAHPDDEILGVGGTVAKHVGHGDNVSALILGEGQTSRWNIREKADLNAVEMLHKNTLDAAKTIGYSKVYFADFPDNRFDTIALLDIVKSVEKYAEKLQPDVVYVHHANDLNIDHRITYQAVLTAMRPIGGYSAKEIYAFETFSSTEWSFGEKEKSFFPNVFIDIEGYLEKKIEAMKKYQSELREFPHPRSLEMLEAAAKKWGGVIGRQYAEAFECIRKIS